MRSVFRLVIKQIGLPLRGLLLLLISRVIIDRIGLHSVLLLLFYYYCYYYYYYYYYYYLAMSSQARKPKVKWTEQMNKDVLECKKKAQELVSQRILLGTRMEGKEDILTL